MKGVSFAPAFVPSVRLVCGHEVFTKHCSACYAAFAHGDVTPVQIPPDTMTVDVYDFGTNLLTPVLSHSGTNEKFQVTVTPGKNPQFWFDSGSVTLVIPNHFFISHVTTQTDGAHTHVQVVIAARS